MFELAGGVIAIFLIACLIVAALFILAGFVKASTNLIQGIVDMIGGIAVPTRTRGGGRHNAARPVEAEGVKDIEGWEAEEVDASTGEVKTFVWRGSRS